MKVALKSEEGLTKRDFNSWLDNYLLNGNGSADLYAQMSFDQQMIIQTIKRSVKRLKTRINKKQPCL